MPFFSSRFSFLPLFLHSRHLDKSLIQRLTFLGGSHVVIYVSRVIHKTTTIWGSHFLLWYLLKYSTTIWGSHFFTLISVKVFHYKSSFKWDLNLKFVSILVTYFKLVQTFFGEDLYLNALHEVVGRLIECAWEKMHVAAIYAFRFSNIIYHLRIFQKLPNQTVA